MKLPLLLASALFAVSALSIGLVFLFSPVLVFLLALVKGSRTHPALAGHPTVSVVIIVRNAAALIGRKIHNTLSLDYPPERLEVIVFSDGSTDDTAREVEAIPDARVTFLSSAGHQGKNVALNAAVARATGEVVVLTDADAILDRQALQLMVAWFSDPAVGGVTGSIAFEEDAGKLKKAQSIFMGFDSAIKHCESRIGSVSSKTGKIAAVRRSLITPLPEAVADDMYIPLSVIRQRRLFVYEERAKAFIRISSRNPRHEIERRRRIVTRSLTAIFSMKELLNPFRHGLFSLNLFINKVMRRCLPVFLLLLAASSLLLASASRPFAFLVGAQVLFYLFAFSFPLLDGSAAAPLRLLRKLSSVAFYFCIGNYGSLLGLADYASGKRVARWNPVKAGA